MSAGTRGRVGDDEKKEDIVDCRCFVYLGLRLSGRAELLLELGGKHDVVDSSDVSFGSDLRGCYLWGPKWLFLLRVALWIRRGGGGRESNILRMILCTSLTTFGI